MSEKSEICEYCNKGFQNKSALNFHQKNTKYCIKLQQEKINFICEHCNKKFKTKSILHVHNSRCKILKEQNKTTNYEIQFIHEELKKKDEELKKKDEELKIIVLKKDEELKIIVLKKDEELKKKDEELIEQKLIIAKLEAKLEAKNEIFNTDHEYIKELAKQPKTINKTTNNLSITTAFNFNDTDKVKNIINTKFTSKYIMEGQASLAQFAYDYILKDDAGNLTYVCTDASRNIFKFLNDKGELEKDFDAKKLTNYMLEGGLCKKVGIESTNYINSTNGKTSTQNFEKIASPLADLYGLNDDNTGFKKGLTKII